MGIVPHAEGRLRSTRMRSNFCQNESCGYIPDSPFRSIVHRMCSAKYVPSRYERYTGYP